MLRLWHVHNSTVQPFTKRLSVPGWRSDGSFERWFRKCCAAWAFGRTSSLTRNLTVTRRQALRSYRPSAMRPDRLHELVSLPSPAREFCCPPQSPGAAARGSRLRVDEPRLSAKHPKIRLWQRYPQSWLVQRQVRDLPTFGAVPSSNSVKTLLLNPDRLDLSVKCLRLRAPPPRERSISDEKLNDGN